MNGQKIVSSPTLKTRVFKISNSTVFLCFLKRLQTTAGKSVYRDLPLLIKLH